MKRSMITLLAVSFTAASAFGQLKAPRKSFSIGDLEEAKARATEENKPLIFVNT